MEDMLCCDITNVFYLFRIFIFYYKNIEISSKETFENFVFGSYNIFVGNNHAQKGRHAKTSVQAKSNPVLNWIVKSAGLAPSYIRMIGTVTLDWFVGEEVAEHIQAPGLWEQMYFGLDEDV